MKTTYFFCQGELSLAKYEKIYKFQSLKNTLHTQIIRVIMNFFFAYFGLEQHLVVYARYLTSEGHGAHISMFIMNVLDGKGKTIYDTIN